MKHSTISVTLAALLLVTAPAWAGESATGGDIGDAADVAAFRRELAANPNKILWEAYDGDNWDLFIMNADGSGKRNLTHSHGQHELYPQASPDGTKIAFLMDVQKDGDTLRSVYYMNIDGTGRTLVAEKARQPCWSPDGAKIAFVPQEFSKFNVTDYVSKGLSIYDLRTGKTTPALNSDHIEHLYNLNWSKDGKWIVSTVHAGMGFGHAIIAIELDGRRIVDLKQGGCRPCLDPDSKRVTWSENDHTVCVADISFAGDEPVVTNKHVVDHREKLHLYHPDFSPDGKYVTYSVGPGGRVPVNGPGTHTQVAEMVAVRGKWNLCLRRASGEGPVIQMTDDETMSNEESEWITPASSAEAGR
jgi:Tol biopolymer transport system component